VINSNDKLFKMKKLFYMLVMIAGMTLTINNVNAQDPKCCGAKEAKMACCKSGDKTPVGKCCNKMAMSDCANKNATTTNQKGKDNKITCKAKDLSTTSEAKGANTPK
jgi:hypothetical protein